MIVPGSRCRHWLGSAVLLAMVTPCPVGCSAGRNARARSGRFRRPNPSQAAPFGACGVLAWVVSGVGGRVASPVCPRRPQCLGDKISAQAIDSVRVPEFVPMSPRPRDFSQGNRKNSDRQAAKGRFRGAYMYMCFLVKHIERGLCWGPGTLLSVCPNFLGTRGHGDRLKKYSSFNALQ